MENSISTHNKDHNNQNDELNEEKSSFLNYDNSGKRTKRNKIFNLFNYIWYLIKRFRFVIFYYIDTVKDIYLIFYLYEKNEIKSAIATSIIIFMATLFMIVFFIWKEINSTNSLCKKFAYSFYYILIFLTRCHIIIL